MLIKASPDSCLWTRRQTVRSLVAGSALFPAILNDLLASSGGDAAAQRRAHLIFRQSQRVIFLFMTGGVSHLDTFDPKPQSGRRWR
jgi:hypothetical protein